MISLYQHYPIKQHITSYLEKCTENEKNDKHLLKCYLLIGIYIEEDDEMKVGSQYPMMLGDLHNDEKYGW